jgi:two-component system sensor kinase FixL
MHSPEKQAFADAAVDAVIVAQDRLTRVARLATLGEMATGMAHELNQPLTAISTYARVCERYLDLGQADLPDLREALREIARESLRAGEIMRRLRQMARSDVPDVRTAVDVSAMIEDLRTLLTADARVHGAELSLELSRGLPRVAADAVQLQQVVLNLARNAFEALQESFPDQRRVEIVTARAPNGMVEIHVSDNGPGVSLEIADRLFDPFASTKGAGTGLGLAMSRTIVRSHGGSIDTRRNPPRGAAFIVRLPALEEVSKW